MRTVGLFTHLRRPVQRREDQVGQPSGLQRLAAIQRSAGNRATALLVQREFTSTSSRDGHFTKHGGEFGARTARAYEQLSESHWASRATLQSKTSAADGKVYVYDRATDTIGIYRTSGACITFFKPGRGNATKGQRYYDNQPT